MPGYSRMNPAPSSIWTLYVEAANAQSQSRGTPGEIPLDKFGGKSSVVFGGGCGGGVAPVAIINSDGSDSPYTIVRVVSYGSSVLSMLTPLPVGAIRYGADQVPRTSCAHTIPFEADHVSAMSSDLVAVYRKSLRDGEEGAALPHEENDTAENKRAD